MSSNINPNLLKQYIMEQVGSKMNLQEAQKLGIQNQFNSRLDEVKEAAETDENEVEIEIDDVDVSELDLDDIMTDTSSNGLKAALVDKYLADNQKDDLDADSNEDDKNKVQGADNGAKA